MSKHVHEIRDPIHVFVRLDSDERAVLDSRPFQRLRHIHQLALTYLRYPAATHKRFEHSLGVMELAGRVFDVVTNPVNVTDEIRNTLVEVSQPGHSRSTLRPSRRPPGGGPGGASASRGTLPSRDSAREPTGREPPALDTPALIATYRRLGRGARGLFSSGQKDGPRALSALFPATRGSAAERDNTAPDWRRTGRNNTHEPRSDAQPKSLNTSPGVRLSPSARSTTPPLPRGVYSPRVAAAAPGPADRRRNP